MTAPNRRWIRFSLRTLGAAMAVVAILAGWVARNLRQVNARRNLAGQVGVLWVVPGDASRVPWIWRAFGDVPLQKLFLNDAVYTEADRERAQAVYPEAEVTRVPSSDDLWKHEMEIRQRNLAPKD